MQAPDHGHTGIASHPERMVHLSGLLKVDIGNFPRERVPLIAGWLSELGFKIKNSDLRPVLGGLQKGSKQQSSSAGDEAQVKRRPTGNYVVTLPTAAEAERLAREIHGRKYSVASKLVRQSPAFATTAMFSQRLACD